MIELNELRKAYFAGCLDCDGCISCSNINGTTPRIRVQVANNDPVLLEALQEIYGGGIDRSGQTCRAWSIDAKDPQLRFINDILPHLMVKRYTANLALEFLSLDVGRGGPTTSRFVVARLRRKQIAVQITRFNHRFDSNWVDPFVEVSELDE